MREEFVCGYCGKKYDTLHERTECEQKCYEKKLATEAKEREEARKVERAQDSMMIEEKIDQCNELIKQIETGINEYYKKYRVYFTTNKNVDFIHHSFPWWF